MDKNDSCACCSGRPYSRCCEPFLNGRALPKTPRQLMRSRYTAYALGGHTDYLKSTWHPADAAAIREADLSGAGLVWENLDIISAGLKGNAGFVEFRARFTDSDGRAGVHHERSVFVRHNNRWYYLSGEVSSEPA